MLNEFREFIEKEQLFTKKDKVLLAVSGGIDSLVMCHLFHRAGFRFSIAHCNYGLRGKESDEDAGFVKKLAEKYAVSFYFADFSKVINKYAKKNGLSVQMAARNLRYNFFESILKDNGYYFIATAHHSDDVAETILMNMIRGTGISGLHGILPKNGHVIRPLLFANRKKIEQYAKKNKLKYREDSSNSSDKYIRNKIRLQVIPILKQINPRLEDTFRENAGRLLAVEKIYHAKIVEDQKKIVSSNGNELYISIAELKKQLCPEAHLFEILKHYNFSEKQTHEAFSLVDSSTGKSVTSSGHRIIKNRESLIITPNKQAKKNSVTISKSTKITEQPLNISFKLIDSKKFKLITDPSFGCFDYEKIKFPLTLRTWKKGDKFIPLGMKGFKKLSDFLIDKKVSLSRKEQTCVLISGSDIIWVAGMRIDNRYRVNEKTKKVFVAQIM